MLQVEELLRPLIGNRHWSCMNTQYLHRISRKRCWTFSSGNNYAVISDGLTSDEVDFLNDFVDGSKQRIPEEWGIGTRDIHDHGQILVEHPQLDAFVQHPTTFPLVEAILGKDVRFAQFDFRELPDGDGRNPMRFHQDHSYLTRQNWDPNHTYQCHYLCRIFYLTDVTEETPCFSVVPNSHPYLTAGSGESGDGRLSRSSDPSRHRHCYTLQYRNLSCAVRRDDRCRATHTTHLL